MPNPKDYDNQDDFHSACMEQLVGEEGYDQDQANAICYDKWEKQDESSRKSLLQQFIESGDSAQTFLDKTIDEEEKWMQKAVDDPGALSQQLSIPEEENIPMELLDAIIEAENGETIQNPTDKGKQSITVTQKLTQRANFARNAKKST